MADDDDGEVNLIYRQLDDPNEWILEIIDEDGNVEVTDICDPRTGLVGTVDHLGMLSLNGAPAVCGQLRIEPRYYGGEQTIVILPG